MKRTWMYVGLIPLLAAAVGWAMWSSQISTTEAKTTPRLSVQVCWPTALGARPTAIAWLASEEYARPAPGSLITPPSAVSHSQFIFDKPVNVEWNYGTHIQALYGDDVPRDTTVVTAMWSPTSGGFRYVGQVSTNTDGIAQIYADMCAAPEPKHAVVTQPVAHAPGKASAKPLIPIGPRHIHTLNMDHRLKYTQLNNGRQYLYFTMTDEDGVSVQGARVDVSVYFPNGVRRYGYGPSDNNGQLYIWFDVSKLGGNREIPIDITATYQNLVTKSRTAFWAP